MLSEIANRLRKVLRSRVVLEHPEDPEDTRVLSLFKNRAELKKELGDAQDEVHRMKDRVKLQDAATARVREQMEALESRLATPLSGLHTLTYYQLRELWATGHAQIAALVRELSQQREDRERRQFLADLNRQLFERSQSARADCAHGEHIAADARARQSGVQALLARSQSWWQYFRRRDLTRRLHAMQAEVATAEQQLQLSRQKLIEIEEQGGAKYPGLSLDARRMLNLMAIACAQIQALRLQPPTLLSRMTDAMSRSEPDLQEAGDAQSALSLMQEIARARAALLQNAAAARADVRRLADLLAAAVKYRSPSETVPGGEALQLALRASLGRGEQMNWDLLGEDLWSLSDLFYGLGE